ncbi:conserved hypothetical protein (plasmid) [Shewanella sp. ANA-3]|uniref:hypothetical protein n=1 Tax=Shewanella sp. (strain ANA-3) TaxID=94122 RepID=UPI00005E1A5E|nr:hypothetical protein [Shewanella sp. ANA-3]ABK50388.1 conserved hypothetical protein [Shewanella sp. ANA-3]
MQKEPRIHHLYVATAKYLFAHPKHGIVKLLDPMTVSDAKRYQLSPILLYGLTVAGLPIRWMTFAPIDAPIAIKGFLANAWEHAKGLRGLPDIVRVNKYLHEACPLLAEALQPLGVELQVTAPNDRSHPGSLRSAQESAQYISMTASSAPPQPQETPFDTLSRYAKDDHLLNVRIAPSYHSGKEAFKIMQWLQQPIHPLSAPLNDTELDWQTGDWLSSWEKSLPESGPRYFKRDSIDNFMWLMNGTNADYIELSDDDEYEHSDNTAELIKMLLANWPGKMVDIAKLCSITLKELNWYLGSAATLPPASLFQLKRILGIGIELEYLLQTINGPYVLMANKPKALEDFYNEYTNGGNASAFEIIPDNAHADPSYRYMLICPYSKLPSLLMVPRGSSIADRIPDLLFNYEGVRRVGAKLYREAVSTCAAVAVNPTNNIAIMSEFTSRYSFEE